MAPRKNDNKINECSAAANKRRRIEVMNGTEFHNIQQHYNTQPNTAAIGADLRLSPPSPVPNEEAAAVDDPLSSLIPQQIILISNHINHMMYSLQEFWGRNYEEELSKVKQIEARLKQKEEQLDLFSKLYHYHQERTVLLEQKLRQMVAGGGEGCTATVAVEEGGSCAVDPDSVESRMNVECKNCHRRPATMAWLPCRHLCMCLMCEKRVKTCPICGAKKTKSFMIGVHAP